MNRSLWSVSVVAGLLLGELCAFGPAAQAEPLTWDWSWTGANTGGGTLTTDPESRRLYKVTAITGTWDGHTITGLAPNESVGGNDNLLLAGSPQLNVFGTAFNIPGDGINLYYNGAVGGYNSFDADTETSTLGMFTATLAPAAVPEPASLSMLGAVLIALGLLHRRKRAA